MGVLERFVTALERMVEIMEYHLNETEEVDEDER